MIPIAQSKSIASQAAIPPPWSEEDTLHEELLAAKKYLYDPCRLACSQPRPEVQNAEYGAYLLTADSASIRFRVAKLTPAKAGHFVTLWQRAADGTTQPYDAMEPIDYVVISTRENDHWGQFVFPRHILAQQQVLSHKGQGGKRGFRVYPPWVTTTSRQARLTQRWQLEYFLEIPPPLSHSVDYDRALLLYNSSSTRIPPGLR